MAHGHFAQARAAMARCDRRAMRPARLMAGELCGGAGGDGSARVAGAGSEGCVALVAEIVGGWGVDAGVVQWFSSEWTVLTGPADSLGYNLVAADAKTAGLIYLVGNANQQTGAGTPSWASQDGGLTWIPLPFTNQGPQGVGQVLPDPDQAKTVYEATALTVIKSIEGGVTCSTIRCQGTILV